MKKLFALVITLVSLSVFSSAALADQSAMAAAPNMKAMKTMNTMTAKLIHFKVRMSGRKMMFMGVKMYTMGKLMSSMKDNTAMMAKGQKFMIMGSKLYQMGQSVYGGPLKMKKLKGCIKGR